MSGFNSHYGFVLRAGAVCKNRDKQLTFIVRVMCRVNFTTVLVFEFIAWTLIKSFSTGILLKQVEDHDRKVILFYQCRKKFSGHKYSGKCCLIITDAQS